MEARSLAEEYSSIFIEEGEYHDTYEAFKTIATSSQKVNVQYNMKKQPDKFMHTSSCGPLQVLMWFSLFQGGNTAVTKADEVVDLNGVNIMGEKNILNKLPVSASNLYSKNIFNFVSNLYDKEKKSININLEDEIIKETLVK